MTIHQRYEKLILVIVKLVLS